MTVGPVQIIAIEFDSLDGLRGQILGELDDLSPVAAVRILDALFVAKDESGDLLALEASELVVCRGFGDVIEGGSASSDFGDDVFGVGGPDERFGVVVPE